MSLFRAEGLRNFYDKFFIRIPGECRNLTDERGQYCTNCNVYKWKEYAFYKFRNGRIISMCSHCLDLITSMKTCYIKCDTCTGYRIYSDFMYNNTKNTKCKICVHHEQSLILLNKEKEKEKENRYNKYLVKCVIRSYSSDKFKYNHSETDSKKNAIKNIKARSSKYKLGCETWEQILGASETVIIDHINKQLKAPYNWNNYGKAWHIDHKIPIMFNNPSYEEQKMRLDFTNLQPLDYRINASKGNRYTD